VLTVQVYILLARHVTMQTLVLPVLHQWCRLVDNAYVLMADIMMLQPLPVLFAQAWIAPALLVVMLAHVLPVLAGPRLDRTVVQVQLIGGILLALLVKLAHW